jgi:outer membrane lipoprotein SlyB
MKRTLIAAPLLLALIAGCSTTNPDVIHPGDAQRLSQVQDATVLSVRPVRVDGSQSGIGGTAGAVAGGVAGSTVGGKNESVVVGVLGAVVGAMLGNAIERAGTSEDAVEIVLQMRNGDRRAIVQAKGQETLMPGEAVMLVTTSGRTRVTKSPPVAGSGT